MTTRVTASIDCSAKTDGPHASGYPEHGQRLRLLRTRGLRQLASASLTGASLLLACGPDKSASSLEVESGAAGAASAGSRLVSATWTFRSTEVDVDIVLTTAESAEDCTTTGELVLNEALAPIEKYVLRQTDCAKLRLTAKGDIVLYGLATRHNWSQEDLVVDTGRETIELGPCVPEGSASPVRFILAAPSCGNDCSCAQLTRRWNDKDVTLPLGKKCE